MGHTTAHVSRVGLIRVSCDSPSSGESHVGLCGSHQIKMCQEALCRVRVGIADYSVHGESCVWLGWAPPAASNGG